MTDKSYHIYIGGYLNEKIVTERSLPSRNPAGSNRMHRIADSLQSAEQSIILVSPATCLRPKLTKKLLHPLKVSRTQTSSVLFCPAIAIPVLSACSSFIFLPLALCRLFKKKKVSAVIIYNFSPLLVMICIWMSLVSRIPVFHNIEDVSIPKLNDWAPGKEVRPVQQLIFFVCMKVIARLSKGLIVPTKRFLKYVTSKPSLVVTGCINVNSYIPEIHHVEKKKLRLLFAGKIENEHGIRVFMNTLHAIDNQNDLSNMLEVAICGIGSKSKWLVQKCLKIKNIKVRYHGFVSDAEYQKLLMECDVCVALQDPIGRYSNYKTPSKVYEYLGNAKAVIATDVGDLSEIPEDVITICSPFNENELFTRISVFVENPGLVRSQAKSAGEYAERHYEYSVVGKNIAEFIRKYY